MTTATIDIPTVASVSHENHSNIAIEDKINRFLQDLPADLSPEQSLIRLATLSEATFPKPTKNDGLTNFFQNVPSARDLQIELHAASNSVLSDILPIDADSVLPFHYLGIAADTTGDESILVRAIEKLSDTKDYSLVRLREAMETALGSEASYKSIYNAKKRGESILANSDIQAPIGYDQATDTPPDLLFRERTTPTAINLTHFFADGSGIDMLPTRYEDNSNEGDDFMLRDVNQLSRELTSVSRVDGLREKMRAHGLSLASRASAIS